MSNAIKIAVSGASGKMGIEIINLINTTKNLILNTAFDQKDSPHIGKIIKNADNNPIKINCDFNHQLKDDVFIDFTRPEATLEYVSYCVKHNVSMVIGTTGFNEIQLKKIKSASNEIPILVAPNMSFGVNATMKLLEYATKIFGKDHDIEIIEAHHKDKVDSPSGTAIKMGEIIANTINKDRSDIFTFNRTSKEKKRVDGEIGFSCIRAGKIIGDHTVLFASDSEILKIEHSALNRSTFASGAIKAAEFIYDMSPGFYNMYDVIDFQIKKHE
jgi:4-hydroxy-tetrahydrodipicolinate reductase